MRDYTHYYIIADVLLLLSADITFVTIIICCASPSGKQVYITFPFCIPDGNVYFNKISKV